MAAAAATRPACRRGNQGIARAARSVRVTVKGRMIRHPPRPRCACRHPGSRRRHAVTPALPAVAPAAARRHPHNVTLVSAVHPCSCRHPERSSTVSSRHPCAAESASQSEPFTPALSAPACHHPQQVHPAATPAPARSHPSHRSRWSLAFRPQLTPGCMTCCSPSPQTTRLNEPSPAHDLMVLAVTLDAVRYPLRPCAPQPSRAR
jgi:hypothetical protein